VFAILSGHEFPDDQVTVKADPERVTELQHRFEASVRPGPRGGVLQLPLWKRDVTR
jgi:hypothetical protein